MPRSAGPLLKTTRVLPRAAAMWLGRRMKADTVFLEALADPERKKYEDRAARTDTKAEDAAGR